MMVESLASKQRVRVGCISPYKAQVYAIQEKLGKKYSTDEDSCLVVYSCGSLFDSPVPNGKAAMKPIIHFQTWRIELAGKGAMPPQLLEPASRRLEIAHCSDRFRQQIRGGSLLCRGVTKMNSSLVFFDLRRTFKVVESFLQKLVGPGAAVDGGGLLIVKASKHDSLHAIDSFSLLLLHINADRSAMLVDLLFAGSRSRSAESTMSIELIVVNKIRRRRRFVFSDEKADSKAFSDDDEISAVVSQPQSVNYDAIVSTQLSNAWFSSNCIEASEWPRKGWRRLTGEFADISDRCASAYKDGKFCETFHLNASGVSDMYQIVKMIVERKFQPIIIFSFSRRECEKHAMSMSKLDLNTEEEKDVVEQVFQNAVFYLNEEDRNLPATELMLPLLQRGIAVHHSDKTVYQKVFERLLEVYKQIKIGDPLEKGTLLGPLHTCASRESFEKGIQKIKTEGGKTLTCGSVIPSEGNFVQPTIAATVDPTSKLLHFVTTKRTELLLLEQNFESQVPCLGSWGLIDGEKCSSLTVAFPMCLLKSKVEQMSFQYMFSGGKTTDLASKTCIFVQAEETYTLPFSLSS
nr:hypothetical protein VITISV_043093 [Ipomoea trifida]